MTFGHSKINTLIKVNTYRGSGGKKKKKKKLDAGKDTRMNSPSLAGFSLSEKV